ncbi:GNAT family N-acetyltransferase [Chromatocurvus halotolerans]|uniref:L-amino acid N-acyltransferase YncA n=1 Tax=Chromatocurvus halotolerans TaxID=1132028 RepID=A0A4R2KL49_9GAMM|nr:GNAT family N-acetyltransferase [Chromatocurvus halotolerans]TCO73227.1 L-amino acid N-acyltransferase YncA [Chromatocurvus halotolerans]
MIPDTSINIRPATVEDIDTILRFIRELADYERALDAVEATPERLRATLFCNRPRVHCSIAELAGEPAGFAVWFFNYSTWLGLHGLFLEDLYVTDAMRGRGLGKALLQHLAKLAVASGCGRFEWNVLDWNRPAIDFYESFGAQPQSEWVGYRLSGEALRAFAASGVESDPDGS